MIRLMNDPVCDLISVAKVLFPKLKVDVYFSTNIPLVEDGKIQKKRQAFGITVFEDDRRTEIYLHCNAPYSELLESLTHELAHAVCGPEENHGRKWKKTLDMIAKTYERNHGEVLKKKWWVNHEYAELGIEQVKAKTKRKKSKKELD